MNTEDAIYRGKPTLRVLQKSSFRGHMQRAGRTFDVQRARERRRQRVRRGIREVDLRAVDRLAVISARFGGGRHAIFCEVGAGEVPRRRHGRRRTGNEPRIEERGKRQAEQVDGPSYRIGQGIRTWAEGVSKAERGGGDASHSGGAHLCAGPIRYLRSRAVCRGSTLVACGDPSRGP